MGWLPALLLGLAMAVPLAWWPWRGSLGLPLARAALAARAVGILAIILLLLDPGLRVAGRRAQPVVLLDRSVSMEAGGRGPGAFDALADSLGEIRPFGTLDGMEPAGPTLLAEALTAAAGGGRPVVVLTDGEVADAAILPADLLARTTVRLVPRPVGADAALASVGAPARIAVGDTLVIEVDLRTRGDWSGAVTIALRDGDRVLGTDSVGAPSASRARIVMRVPWPAGLNGERWLEVVRTGAPDAEPGNDVRWLHLTVTPSPGVVVIVTTPDWDARALFRTLREVTATPVRGYVALETGNWRRMDDLRPVRTAEVLAAARAADLLAVRGDTTAWRTMGRARLLWPATGTPGDWYAGPGGPSPIGGALGAEELDSLPALAAASAVRTGASGWTGLTVRLARRGAQVPVLAGEVEGGTRRVVMGVQGLHRWAMRGGAPEQAWRTAMAGAAGWLLASPPQSGALAVPVQRVTPRGQAVRFRWSGPGAAGPVPVAFTQDGVTRTDTLRFDATAVASVVLPVGRYAATVAELPVGAVGVEPFSEEWLASPATLDAREAGSDPPPTRRSLRELLPLFALALAGFSAEWLLRRRLGLR